MRLSRSEGPASTIERQQSKGETHKLCGPVMRINLVEGETQKLSINSEFFSAKSRFVPSFTVVTEMNMS
ncbi:hypothetical protein YC2023_114575 [Brassica napus]